MKTLGQRIKERLSELGLRPAELCRLSGVSKAAMSEIINNSERDPRAASLFAIASALQLDPVWLYIGKTGDERFGMATPTAMLMMMSTASTPVCMESMRAPAVSCLMLMMEKRTR